MGLSKVLTSLKKRGKFTDLTHSRRGKYRVLVEARQYSPAFTTNVYRHIYPLSENVAGWLQIQLFLYHILFFQRV
ncbi:hypothetical protein D0Y50_03580 [Salinimonas sediminis]|uniref:Uncharacterized protein n=1 Tax=Salinimonas sediminis TaxID=2303538 RepID=A0A346NJ25_9ALTE|nr:hypothetical protein D0Y50_03580 [Salinimonas sediminis]